MCPVRIGVAVVLSFVLISCCQDELSQTRLVQVREGSLPLPSPLEDIGKEEQPWNSSPRRAIVSLGKKYQWPCGWHFKVELEGIMFASDRELAQLLEKRKGEYRGAKLARPS